MDVVGVSIATNNRWWVFAAKMRAAAGAGLRRGDVIIELNREPLRTATQFQSAYQRASDKSRLLPLVYREGSTMYLLLEK